MYQGCVGGAGASPPPPTHTRLPHAAPAVAKSYTVDNVAHIISSSDWSKIQAATAFYIMACVSAGLCVLCVASALYTFWTAKQPGPLPFTLVFVFSFVTFVTSFVGVWPFVLYMGSSSSQYGAAFGWAVAACVLALAVSVASFWVRTQLVLLDRGQQRPRRRHRKASSKRSRRSEEAQHRANAEMMEWSDHEIFALREDGPDG